MCGSCENTLFFSPDQHFISFRTDSYRQKNSLRLYWWRDGGREGLARPRPPGQAGQHEGDEQRGEEVNGVVVQYGLPTDALRGGRLVAHHLPQAAVEACRAHTHHHEALSDWLTGRHTNTGSTYQNTACELPAASLAWSPAGRPRLHTGPGATGAGHVAGPPLPPAGSHSRPHPPPHPLQNWLPGPPESLHHWFLKEGGGVRMRHHHQHDNDDDDDGCDEGDDDDDDNQ